MSEKVTYCLCRKESRMSSSLMERLLRIPLGSWWTKQKMQRFRHRRTRTGSGNTPRGFPPVRMTLSLFSPRLVSQRRRNRLRLERKCRSRRSKTGSPPTERIRSPAPTPALSAADPLPTDSTRTPALSGRFGPAVRAGVFPVLRFMDAEHYRISRAGTPAGAVACNRGPHEGAHRRGARRRGSPERGDEGGTGGVPAFQRG